MSKLEEQEHNLEKNELHTYFKQKNSNSFTINKENPIFSYNDPNYSDQYSKMAFRAIQENDQKLLVNLLNKNLVGIDTREMNLAAGDFYGKSLFDVAIANYNLEICKILIYFGMQKSNLDNLDYEYLLNFFFKEDNKEGVDFILDLHKWQQICEVNLAAQLDLPVEEDF